MMQRKLSMTCALYRDTASASATGHVSPSWSLESRVACYVAWGSSSADLERAGVVMEYDAVVWLAWDTTVQPKDQDETQDLLTTFQDARGRDMEIPDMLVLRVVRNSGPKRRFARAYCKARGA